MKITLTGTQKARIEDIVKSSRLKPGTFEFAYWFGGDISQDDINRIYFVGGRTTPFIVYYSTHRFGQSHKRHALTVYKGHHKLPDAEIASEMIKAIEYGLSKAQ